MRKKHKSKDIAKIRLYMLTIIDMTTDPESRVQNQRGRKRAIEKIKHTSPALQFIAENQYQEIDQ